MILSFHFTSRVTLPVSCGHGVFAPRRGNRNRTAMIIETTAVTIRSLCPAVGIETASIYTPRNPQACRADQFRRRAFGAFSRRNNLVPFGICVADALTSLMFCGRNRRAERSAWFAARLGFLLFLLHGGILTERQLFAITY